MRVSGAPPGLRIYALLRGAERPRHCWLGTRAGGAVAAVVAAARGRRRRTVHASCCADAAHVARPQARVRSPFVSLPTGLCKKNGVQQQQRQVRRHPARVPIRKRRRGGAGRGLARARARAARRSESPPATSPVCCHPSGALFRHARPRAPDARRDARLAAAAHCARTSRVDRHSSAVRGAMAAHWLAVDVVSKLSCQTKTLTRPSPPQQRRQRRGHLQHGHEHHGH